MQRYIIRRLLGALIVALGACTVVFLLLRLSGDPVSLLLPVEASYEDYVQLKHSLGFDRPLVVQYLNFLKNAIKGDFGTSLRYRSPALPLVLERLPATFELTGFAVLIGLAIGIPVGVLCAVHRGKPIDVAGMWLSLFGQAVPVFWLALELILIFAVKLRLFPTYGRGGIQRLILPATAVGLPLAAIITRLLKSTMEEVLAEDYVRTANAKGLAPSIVLFKHALRNAIGPVLTIVGVQFGSLLGGAVVTEMVFAWPGMGRLLLQAVGNRDFEVVQAVVFVTALLVTGANLIADILCAVVDPRVRYE